MIPEEKILEVNSWTLKLVEDSYETVVCDHCGRRKKCDYWKNAKDPVPRSEWIGMDLCRTCSKKLLKEQDSHEHF